MLKKYFLITIVTLAALAVSFEEFYFLKGISTRSASLIHNGLASAVGLGFIIASELLKKQNKKRDAYSNTLLAIGVVMLSIHLIKIFLGKCA
jgi:hypothetical protein